MNAAPVALDQRRSFLDEPDDAILTALRRAGQPAYRLKQLKAWIFRERVVDFRAMTDVPTTFREWLDERYVVLPLKQVRLQESTDGWTRKALFALTTFPAVPGRPRLDNPRRETVEAVLMRYDPADGQRGRLTVCASSQAGCAVGCPFCATGQAGFFRQLTTGEIIAQVLALAVDVRPVPITNVVFMGQGEPLLNLAAVWRAIETLHDPLGLAIGARHITLSTVGIVPGIREVTDLRPPVRLAVSLHAPNDTLRDQLVPINRKYPIAELLSACRAYGRSTGRRITFEYALMGGVNDDLGLARQLAKLIGGLPSHVNLIPLNPTPGSAFVRPSPDRVDRFREVLVDAGILTTVRVERGIDILAGCGQLRADEVGTTGKTS